MITFKSGDIFESKMQTIVNPINCNGSMGKGLALKFKEMYPHMYADYLTRYDKQELKIGKPYLWTKNLGYKILNFPTKDGWFEDSKLKYIKSGLDYLLFYYKDWGIESIAFPALGCGEGKLKWEEVKELMVEHLVLFDIPVEIYEPRNR